MTANNAKRTVKTVTPYVNGQGAKRCKVEVVHQDGSAATVALHDLSRPELQQAAKLVFPSITANVWLRFKSERIQTLIRENDLPAAEAAVAEVKATPSPDKGGATPVEATPAPVDVPQAVEAALGGNEKTPAEKLAEVLAELQGKGGVDQEQLEAAVKAEVSKVADSIRITRVEVRLPDGDRQLPDLHHKDLPKLIAKVAAGCNVFIVGPAGTGKSVAAEQVAEALNRRFFALSFGPTTPTSKLFGYNDANGNFQSTPLYEAYNAEGEGGLFLGDELDNGHPGLLAEQNQFLANSHCAFACGMVKRHADFQYLATGNTYGRGGDRLFVGRNQLDAATLDRFVFHTLNIDEDLEEKAALRWSTADSVEACRAWIATVRKVRAEAEALKIPMVASPRASIDGCKLITTGAFTRDEVIEDVLLKGVGADVRAKLKV